MNTASNSMCVRCWAYLGMPRLPHVCGIGNMFLGSDPSTQCGEFLLTAPMRIETRYAWTSIWRGVGQISRSRCDWQLFGKCVNGKDGTTRLESAIERDSCPSRLMVITNAGSEEVLRGLRISDSRLPSEGYLSPPFRDDRVHLERINLKLDLPLVRHPCQNRMTTAAVVYMILTQLRNARNTSAKPNHG